MNILNNNPSAAVLGQQSNTMSGNFPVLINQGIPQQLDQMKRKKLREMIFGMKQQSQQTQSMNYFVKMQKEDIQNHYRNLKITNNITMDENIRLKTKIQ